ncbi:MAG: site-specific DNA-methyltransferase [Lachnospiraceae bacterium]|nr:site-specific DNA-methyltransferase [Lachnospiraceae bacterium]
MEKLKMESKDILNENIEKVAELFPNCLVESEEGKKIDFDMLRQELSGDIVDGPRERYHLDFPGKREAIVESNRKITKTLRPIKDKSVNFDTTKNIYIEGDNLEALKILQESYLGKIKCIYIDPPYNTGNDFVYNDKFSHEDKEEQIKQGRMDEDGNIFISKDINNETKGRYHSDWLKMMYPRLKLARNLLSDDGVIFISIDDNEQDNIKKICNEVFGNQNFISEIPILSNPRGRQSSEFIAQTHEYLIVVAKNVNKCVIYGEELTEEQKKEYSYKDEKGSYRLLGLRLRGGRATAKESPTLHFPIYYNIDKDEFSLDRKSTNDYEMIPKFENGVLGTWRWSKTKIMNQKDELMVKPVKDRYDIFQKDYLKETKTMKLKSLWAEKDINYDNSARELNELDMNDYFDYAKPLYLMKKIIKSISSCKENMILLDFFSGSATTAHAVMKLNAEGGGNCQFIMVQLPEATDENSEAYKAGFKNICDIGEERIRRAGKKVLEESKNNVGAKLASPLDIGFRVYKIDDSNMKDIYYKPDEIDQKSVLDYISNVKEDRTALDLLTQVMLNLGLTLDLKIEEKKIEKNLFYFVEDNALVACFDNKIDLDSLSKAIECKPLKIVCKESSFEKDQDKINFNERIKKYSPETEKYII